MGLWLLGWKWEQCKYLPNDLEENQIRSVSKEAGQNKTVSGRSGLGTQRVVFSKTTRKMGTKSASVTRKLPKRQSEPPFFISVPFRPTLKSSRWKSADCARIPAASARHTKARHSCFPYGAGPWSCKIINPMAARAGLWLSSRAKNAACHHLSGRHTRSVKSGIFKQASVLQSSAGEDASENSGLSPYMSDKPSRIKDRSERNLGKTEGRRKHCLHPCKFHFNIANATIISQPTADINAC